MMDRYQQLVKLTQSIASILQTEQLLDRITKVAVELCRADASWLLLADPTRHWLHIGAVYSPNNVDCDLTVRVDSSMAGQVFSSQQPALVLNPPSFNSIKGELINLTEFEIGSLLSVPVSFSDQHLGVLEVVSRAGEYFSPLDQQILSDFANIAAIFIDNSGRFLQTDLVPELVHELRTPLASLNTALHLLLRDDLSQTRRDQITRIIQTEFNRLAELTTSFLDYARLKSGRARFQPVRFDLNQLLDECVEVLQLQAESRNVKIHLEMPLQKTMLSADREKIKQVAINLINNAIKYNRPVGLIHITIASTAKEVSFSVRDNGQGIPDEYTSRLFERFFRAPTTERQVQGTGLGLSICKQIVDAHKGRIEVSSKVDQGSTFTVYLPVDGTA